jgi:hypothetical protein
LKPCIFTLYILTIFFYHILPLSQGSLNNWCI